MDLQSLVAVSPFIGAHLLIRPGQPPLVRRFGWTNFGLIPQIITDRLPIITQLGVNGYAYLWSTVNAAAQTAFRTE